MQAEKERDRGVVVMNHRVIEIFKEISKIPRCSKQCDRIANFICGWANNNGFKCRRDSYGNVIVNVPATKGFENKPSLALQGHMDMVCVKDENSSHNFGKDPIEVIEKDGWLVANGTTLGADDGVALAIGMALAEDETKPHPELELVFTADEEIGLVGAMHLDNNFIRSKRLINIDSEKEGVFVIGCAGGEDIDLSFPVKRQTRRFSDACRIAVSRLKGGHSGAEINHNRANAIKLLNEILDRSFSSVELVELRGGKARNAIPDFAEAIIFTDDVDEVKSIAKSVKNYALALFADEDDLSVEVEKTDTGLDVAYRDNFRKIVDLINKLPHGVYEMYDEVTPKTSNNLAVVKLDVDNFQVSLNQRSLTEDGLDRICSIVEKIGKEFSCDVNRHSRYPSWTPKNNSELLKNAKRVFVSMFSKNPIVKVIHAGLECGIFVSKLPEDVEMVSIGPDMRDIHSPKEKLNIDSFVKTYEFVCELVRA